MKTLGAIFAMGLALLLAACGSGPSKPTPKPLQAVKPQIAGRVVWSTRIPSVNFPMAVSEKAGVFTIAASDGTVIALEAQGGREVWRANAGAPISAGVGSDGRVAAVVTRDSEVVAFEGGKVLWKQRVGSRVVTAPLVAGERVFVVGIDRTVIAFDALDGTRLWTVQRPGDALTLSQAGVLAAFKDTLLVGQGPRLTGLDPSSGAVRWEGPIATPRGSNEVERLADLVGPAARVDSVVCGRAFQAAVGCINADTGALVWSKPIGGRQGVAADARYMYSADGTDRITAWKIGSGEVVWSTDALLYRELSAPISLGATVVFGDAEGMLHFLSAEQGAPQLRVATDGSQIAAAPVTSGKTLLWVTRNGGVFALRPE